MVPGDNFLSLSLSASPPFLITRHDIHGYFFSPPTWLQRVQRAGPWSARPGGGSDRRPALFTSAASRCNLVNHVANGGTRRSAPPARHNEGSFTFHTMGCLSQSARGGGDGLALCDASREAARLLPPRQADAPAPVGRSWSRKGQAAASSWEPTDGRCGVKGGLERPPLPGGGMYSPLPF